MHSRLDDRSSRWLLVHGARQTFHRFRDDLRAQPDRARRRLAWTVTGGFAIALAVMFALVLLVRRMDESGRLAWEAPLVGRVDQWQWFSFSTALWAETPGNSVFMIPVILAAALLTAWVRRPLRALAVLASFFMLDLVVLAGWLAWNRPRPDVVAGGIGSPGLHSFPSGHVAQMVAAYGLFTWMWIRASRSAAERVFAALLLTVGVVLVALARLRLGSHWPTDLVAGLIIGGLWLAVIIVALRRAEAEGGR
ncbi:MAG TPA: phosphatase PAP2 family protein [Longimicrobium sp.]|nr:phosphatase PAP2 family protein [Longimicrobium sp.]